jgi:precorrin-6Y C5,15-methyltransferase (decarboxylating)
MIGVQSAGNPVTVIGIDGIDGNPTPPALDALSGARLVVGAARYLDAVRVPAHCERVVLGPIDAALQRITAAVDAGDRVVVLAGGDPGFFGMVRRLRFAGLAVNVMPAVSAVAAAFARVGLPWDSAAVVTAHGRDLRPALNACRALPSVAVLTEPGAGAAEIGAGLLGWDRQLVVAENLGTDAERVTRVTAQQAAERRWADPHVVLVLACPETIPSMRSDNQPAAAPACGWALPESAYAHRDSMITKAEVRALAVARLRPRLGRLIWDVGAGSGSVGIECALLGAAVVAVEQDADACTQIRQNAAAHGVDVRVVQGSAPQVLTGVPAPDAVFIGGGGLQVVAAVAGPEAGGRPERMVVALAALDRVAPVVNLLRDLGYSVDGVQLAASRLADLPGGSIRLQATNPVIVLTGDLTGEWCG